ncbi:hypothetical protein [Stenotrophomonas humi]|uniref:hypothetical protein n=1 Tax=Stenotrophomonas humi TaxID=405444 RepID=UPI00128FB11C|nr:hypothetical protein [Stenotrophomonas humi]
MLVMLMAPGVVLAKPAELPFKAGESFQAQQQKVRADLLGGEVYSEISAEDRQRVVAALDRMSGLIGEGSAESLSPEHKTQVVNDQELVNTVLTKAREDSRLICRREKSLGSQMASSQCFTVAQRDRMRQDSRSRLQSMQSGKDVKVGN